MATVSLVAVSRSVATTGGKRAVPGGVEFRSWCVAFELAGLCTFECSWERVRDTETLKQKEERMVLGARPLGRSELTES